MPSARRVADSRLPDSKDLLNCYGRTEGALGLTGLSEWIDKGLSGWGYGLDLRSSRVNGIWLGAVGRAHAYSSCGCRLMCYD